MRLLSDQGTAGAVQASERGTQAVPMIPEEKIDRVLDELVDAKETVEIQTQAIGKLGEMLDIHGQWLAKIWGAVSKKPEGDPLGELLRTLVTANKEQAAVLQQILKAVQRPGG